MPIATAISLFTGGMGLDLGFEREGFKIRVAVENNPRAVETIRTNRPNLRVVPRDLKNVSTEELLEEARLKVGEATVLIGAPPCEPFSTAGRRNGFADPRADAVYQFIRVVREARPAFFVMEEVPAFTRAAKRHVSFYERVKKRPEDLDPDERLGSAFEEVMARFRETGYVLSYDVLNAADYGVPQKRKRFIMIGARGGAPVPLPEPSHSHPKMLEAAQSLRKPWVTFRQALRDLSDARPEYTQFPPSWRSLLDLVPAGGCWKSLPAELHRQALGGAYDDPNNPRTKGLKGGRTGFLRRLSWEAPAPTLVDRPTTKAGCLCHPDQTRPLSVKEYARLQGFPDDWLFCGPISARYRLVGQATPVLLAKAVAVALLDHVRRDADARARCQPVSSTSQWGLVRGT